jgi:hypothetical protein
MAAAAWRGVGCRVREMQTPALVQKKPLPKWSKHRSRGWRIRARGESWGPSGDAPPTPIQVPQLTRSTAPQISASGRRLIARKTSSGGSDDNHSERVRRTLENPGCIY